MLTWVVVKVQSINVRLELIIFRVVSNLCIYFFECENLKFAKARAQTSQISCLLFVGEQSLDGIMWKANCSQNSKG